MSGLPNLQKLVGAAAEIRAYHAQETDEIPGGQQTVMDHRALLAAAPALAELLIACEQALRGLLNDDELCRYPPDGDECFCSACKRIREARAALARLADYDKEIA